MHKRMRIVITSVLSLVLVLIFLIWSAIGRQKNVQSANTEVNEATTAAIDPGQSITPEIMPESTEEEKDTIEESDFTMPEDGVRPVAVMIDNEGTRVLPQGGLDKAQIVYEMIVEGGLSRLMPVFWGTKPEMIGPVRSSRHYFLDYSMEHDAIYVHFGWSTQAEKDIPKLKINNINGLFVGSDVIWDLTKDPGNWQDSYTSMEKLTEYASKKKYRLTSDVKFPFEYYTASTAPTGGREAAKISLKYPAAIIYFEYDSSSGTYKRSRNGKPHMERISGLQLEAKNIIIRYTKNFDIPGDKLGRQDMITTGSGNGIYITMGKAIDIKWAKESRSGPTSYTDKAGNDIVLNRGQTWIQVMPLTSKVTIE